MLVRALPFLLVAPLLLSGCLEGPSKDPPSTGSETPTPDAPSGAFGIASTAFQPQQQIPKDNTCDGANKSVPLAFTQLPANATHLALIMEDPDVPTREAPQRTVLHWTFWNL
ncbi:MAG TPA: YbhB/YbcL family Raf kinase inhibitor-like protein, partial [Candidatus Thermoplasmatota archaeon]|nr:YbhB/YbcL family Raf kinase inhibitor-like protein [Candidatus Thermoplasmatota archaeon]